MSIGIIIKVHSNQFEVDIMLSNNKIDYNIPIDNIKYHNKPLFDFLSLTDISKRNLYDKKLFCSYNNLYYKNK